MSKKILYGAQVYTRDFKFENKTIVIDGDKIDAVLEADAATKISGAEKVDMSGKYIIPGLVDIHLHGAVGVDFCDENEEAFHKIAEYEASHGTVALCPTTMTLSFETLSKVMEYAKAAASSQKQTEAHIIGINMEGPFVSREKCGAQNTDYLCDPDVKFFDKLQEKSGNLIKLVDIAPELNGADEFIKEVSKKCRVSLAHTMADYEIASKAFKLGAKHVTHLHNAMRPLLNREPGLIGAAFDDKDVTPELICDGFHNYPTVVRATFKMFGADRVILISDSCMAVGMPNGEYSLGGQKVYMTDRKATLENGTIAGSASNLMDCLQQCISVCDIPVCDAIRAATFNPAKALEALDEYGTIEAGKRASLVVLDKDYKFDKTILNGDFI